MNALRVLLVSNVRPSRAWKIANHISRKVLGAGILIFMLFPVLILIAVLAVLDNGWPFIYRRRVLGTTGEFDAFKFRSKGITTPQCAQSLVKAGAQAVLLDFVGVSVNQIRQSFLRVERRLAEVYKT